MGWGSRGATGEYVRKHKEAPTRDKPIWETHKEWHGYPEATMKSKGKKGKGGKKC